jgi:hypothetical protein
MTNPKDEILLLKQHLCNDLAVFANKSINPTEINFTTLSKINHNRNQFLTNTQLIENALDAKKEKEEHITVLKHELVDLAEKYKNEIKVYIQYQLELDTPDLQTDIISIFLQLENEIKQVQKEVHKLSTVISEYRSDLNMIVAQRVSLFCDLFSCDIEKMPNLMYYTDF